MAWPRLQAWIPCSKRRLQRPQARQQPAMKCVGAVEVTGMSRIFEGERPAIQGRRLGRGRASADASTPRAAKPAVSSPRICAERAPAHGAAVPSPGLRRERAVAHDVQARFSAVVAPGRGACHPVDRV